MRTVYVAGLPNIIIVCTKPIEIGEEILLDYGDAYNNAYILPKRFASAKLSGEELMSELPPFDDIDNSSD
jgi:SET domain-containing protein